MGRRVRRPKRSHRSRAARKEKNKMNDKPKNNRSTGQANDNKNTKAGSEQTLTKEVISEAVSGALTEKGIPQKKSSKKAQIALFVIKALAGIFIAFVCSFFYQKMFKAPMQIKSVSVSVIGDLYTLSPDNPRTPGKVINVDELLGKAQEGDTEVNVRDLGAYYAPRLNLSIEHKGTIKSAFVYYKTLHKDDNQEEFIVQKVCNGESRWLNFATTSIECEFVLNYTLPPNTESSAPQRIYIVVIDSSGTPSVYCAVIERYQTPIDSSAPIRVDVKSDSEIYEIVPYGDISFWAFNRNEIQKDISDVLKMVNNR